MNIKCGIDIIEISRIKENIDNLGNKFLNRIYSQKEIEYCESKGKQKYQHYAARFAAKEATFKAFSNKLDNNIWNWKDYEIINDKNGKPFLNIDKSKFDIQDIDISLSHCKDYAIANVAILFK